MPNDSDDPPARAAEVWQRSEACAVVGDGLSISELAARLVVGRRWATMRG